MIRVIRTDGSYIPPKPYRFDTDSEEDFERNLGDFDLDIHVSSHGTPIQWGVFSFIWVRFSYKNEFSYSLLPDPNSKMWSDSKEECLKFVEGIAGTKLADQTIRCFVNGKFEKEWKNS